MTAIEFALVGSALFMLFFALVETCWQLATGMALQYGAAQATRFAITGLTTDGGIPASANAPACRNALIPWLISYTTADFIAYNRLSVQPTAFASFANAQAQNSGASGSAGAASQTVVYSITYQQPFLTPFASMVMGSQFETFQTQVTVQNEPFPQNAPQAGC